MNSILQQCQIRNIHIKRVLFKKNKVSYLINLIFCLKGKKTYNINKRLKKLQFCNSIFYRGPRKYSSR